MRTRGDAGPYLGIGWVGGVEFGAAFEAEGDEDPFAALGAETFVGDAGGIDAGFAVALVGEDGFVDDLKDFVGEAFGASGPGGDVEMMNLGVAHAPIAEGADGGHVSGAADVLEGFAFGDAIADDFCDFAFGGGAGGLGVGCIH